MKNSKRGSSAVFLTVILAALFSITLALIYSIREESTISIADAVINLAGDSLLSEYDKYVQQEYGLFIIKGTDNELSEKLENYVGYSLDSMDDISVGHISASAGRYSLSDVNHIRNQLLEYLKFAEAADVLNDLLENDSDPENTMEYRSLKHGPTITSLPSSDLPGKSLTAMAESIAENVSDMEQAFKKGTDQYRINLYILNHFNNMSHAADTDHFFRNEAEYILGGELTDKKNEKRVEMALKAMRFPINLAHIYADEKKLAAVTAMAELLTPGAAAAATQAALASTWAYAESDNDVELLWQGYKVPAVKDSSSWAIDLDSAVEGITDTAKPSENKGYTYEQYLQILLFFQDRNTQTARILDLIQINTRANHDGTFLIKEHSVGLTVDVMINDKRYVYDKSTKGFYTVEAAIFLPIVLLAVLSLGYFMRVEGTWENCIHGAADESMLIASRSYDGVSYLNTGSRIKKRITNDNPELGSLDIRNLRLMYNDGTSDKLTSYTIHASTQLSLPMGFQRDFQMDFKIKYRGFVGSETAGTPLGITGLETSDPQSPVWIFPVSGEKYHKQDCTYVKASVTAETLSSSLRQKYSSCKLCGSDDMSSGSIVFCFKSDDTSYHKGSCPSINRQTIMIDKTDAEFRNLTPCSKCGG